MKPFSPSRYSFVEALKFGISLVLTQSTVILSPLIVRVAGISEYGRIEVALAFSGVLTIVFSLGLHQLVGVRFVRMKGDMRPLVETTLLYLVGVIVLAGLLLLGVKVGLFSSVLRDATEVELFAIITFAALLYFKNLTLSIASMSFKVNLYLALETLAALFYVLAIFGMVFIGELNLNAVMLANIASVMPNLYVFVRTAWRKRESIKIEIGEILEFQPFLQSIILLRAAIPLMLVGLLASSGGYVDKLLLSHYSVSDEGIGMYSLSFRIVGIVPLGLQTLLGHIHSRQIYHDLSEDCVCSMTRMCDVIKKNAKLAVISFAFMMAIFVLSYFTLDIVLPLIYGFKIDSIPWYFVLSAAFAILLSSSFLTPFCIYTERTSSLLVANFLGIVGLLVLSYVAIPIMGVWASAAAFLLMQTLRFLYLAAVCRGIYMTNYLGRAR